MDVVLAREERLAPQQLSEDAADGPDVDRLSETHVVKDNGLTAPEEVEGETGRSHTA